MRIKRLIQVMLLIIAVGIGSVGSLKTLAQAPEMNAIVDIAWRADGNYIARAYGNGTVEVLDVVENEIVFSFVEQLPGIWASVDWNPMDNSKLAAGVGSQVYVWDIGTGQNLLVLQAGTIDGIANTEAGSLPEAIPGIAWSPDGSRLASVSRSGSLRIWDATAGQILLEIFKPQTSSIVWSPNGTRLFTDGGLALTSTDVGTGQVQRLGENAFQPGSISSIDVNSDGTKLVNSTVFGEVTVWDITTGQFIHFIETFPKQLIRQVKWSPDGSRFASAGWDGTVRVWDTVTGEELTVIRTNYQIFSVAWSPDGTEIAYGGESGTLEIVPVSTGQQPLITHRYCSHKYDQR